VPGSTTGRRALQGRGRWIIVRTREHKANKIEGNPLHPVNAARCARGVGTGSALQPRSDQGADEASANAAKGNGRDQLGRGDQDACGQAAEIKPQSRSTTFSDDDRRGDRRCSYLWKLYGSAACIPPHREADPTIRNSIANASYLLSFGARFLRHGSPPSCTRSPTVNFAESGKARGKFVREPRMSLTGQRDEWLPAGGVRRCCLLLLR
jgi:hypothetical protein